MINSWSIWIAQHIVSIASCVHAWPMLCLSSVKLWNWCFGWRLLLVTICVRRMTCILHPHQVRWHLDCYWWSDRWFFVKFWGVRHRDWFLWHMAHTYVHDFTWLLPQLTFYRIFVDLIKERFFDSFLLFALLTEIDYQLFLFVYLI